MAWWLSSHWKTDLSDRPIKWDPNFTLPPFMEIDGVLIPTDGEAYPDPSDPEKTISVFKEWYPPGVTTLLSHEGFRASVLADGSVLKYGRFAREAEDEKRQQDVEHHILTALGNHPRVVRYLGRHKYGLRFQHEVNNNVCVYVSRTGMKNIPMQQREQWVHQATESIAFIHSKGALHVNINPANFLLDEKLDLRLCGFSGSLMGEWDSMRTEDPPYFLPRDVFKTPANVKTDLFALASTMYYFLTGHDPHHGLTEAKEFEARFERGEWPDTSDLKYGRTIIGCWTQKFESAEEVLASLKKEESAKMPKALL